MAANVMKPGSGGGGRGRRRRSGGAPLSEINVTPFVDVMLVLLIIFMVAAPLMTAGVPVDLPETQAAALPAPTAPPTVVTIDDRGEVFVGDDLVGLGALRDALLETAPSGEEERIYLRADGAVAYGRVAEVMAELYGGGFRNIAFVSRGGESQPPQ
ncbi:MAG: ExbD/TolR family protein [Pseudomonadota bacterium]